MTFHQPLFLNTVVLGGSTADKLRAAHGAGFNQVELWQKDVDGAPGGFYEVNGLLSEFNLGLTDYQVLLDFDGASAQTREAKRQEALKLLDGAVLLGTSTIIVPANTRSDCDADRVVEDLRWISHEAAKRHIRIAYEAMAWSHIHSDIPSAWATITAVNASNLGLVVDAFHIFARERTAADLKDIPVERIYLVQLSDLDEPVTPESLVDTARHRRLLPGQGHFPLQLLLEALAAKGYRGPIGLEVFNDALSAQDPKETAIQAMAALKAVLA